MTQKPGLIDQTLVHGDLLFTTHRDRCRYIGLSARDQLLWLESNGGKWQRIQDVQKEAAPLAPPVESETRVAATPAAPNGQTSPRDVQKDGDDKDDVALANTLLGDCLRPCEPTSLPTPVKENAAYGSTNAELGRPAKAAIHEAVGSQTESTPLGAMGRKKGRGSGHQLKKKKLPAEVSQDGRKLSPERMRIALDSLREYPILSHAASRAGIHRKTLEYWIKCSKAGNDGYDIEWQGEISRFHEHCEAATDEAHDKLLAAVLRLAMGGMIYKTDQALVDRGYQGIDAYLRDENGNPVIETYRNPNGEMLRLVLEWLRPEKWGKHPKIDVPQKGGVLVIGGFTEKPENSSAASIKARKWKARSRRIREAKP